MSYILCTYIHISISIVIYYFTYYKLLHTSFPDSLQLFSVSIRAHTHFYTLHINKASSNNSYIILYPNDLTYKTKSAVLSSFNNNSRTRNNEFIHTVLKTENSQYVYHYMNVHVNKYTT